MILWSSEFDLFYTFLNLSWLGAECDEKNRRYTEVTLHTWIKEGCQQEAQYWAVAANDVNA